MKWSVEFLNDKVEKEYLALPKDMQARFIRVAELIETHGIENVGLPHIRPLEDKLWEMRARGKAGISRGIYVTVTGKRVIILRVFIKKTQKTPKEEIRLAKRRIQEI